MINDELRMIRDEVVVTYLEIIPAYLTEDSE
jgi:hypothetical protein